MYCVAYSQFLTAQLQIKRERDGFDSLYRVLHLQNYLLYHNTKKTLTA